MQVKMICSGLAAVLLVSGILCLTLGSAGERSIEAADPKALFQSLGTACNVTAVHHTAKSIRTKEACGVVGDPPHACYHTIDVCEDKVSYRGRDCK